MHILLNISFWRKERKSYEDEGFDETIPHKNGIMSWKLKTLLAILIALNTEMKEERAGAASGNYNQEPWLV